MRKTHLLLVAALWLAMSACAYSKQRVALTAADIKPVECAHNGQGKAISLSVADEREDVELGRRGGTYGAGAAISADGDVIETLKRGLHSGFKNCGFNVLSFDDSSASKVVVELRHLNYSTSVGFWSGGIHVKAAAKVRVPKRDDTEWSKIIREEKEVRRAFVPTKSKNAEWINEVFNELIKDIISDNELYANL